ncbi:MAG: insulinase family protein [Deltaproteobacteria bacterium]|nr:insulinase family protein [Deltaproteobacteria bacterium]
MLLNDILGGSSLSSRLGGQIRSTLGLAYSVYSSFGFSADYGIFFIFAQTKTESVDSVLSEVKKQLSDLVQGDSLTQEELEEHRSSFLNSLYSSLEPLKDYVSQEARFAFLGYPKNYLQKFRKEIKKVKLSDLKKVAKNYIKSEDLKILVLGPDSLKLPKAWKEIHAD